MMPKMFKAQLTATDRHMSAKSFSGAHMADYPELGGLESEVFTMRKATGRRNDAISAASSFDAPQSSSATSICAIHRAAPFSVTRNGA